MSEKVYIETYRPPYKRKDDKKYFDWLEQLYFETKNIYNAFEIWNKIKNNDLKISKDILKWQEENFSYRVVLQLTRLLETSNQDDDRNIIKFLTEVKNKNLISFENYKKDWTEDLYKSAGLSEDDLKMNFEILTGQKTTDTCFCIMINKDIDEINKQHKKFNKFRNKIIAHLTERPDKLSEEEIKTINYDDIENCLVILNEIIKKYSQLMYGYYKSLDNSI